MYKRITIFFTFTMMCFGIAIFRIYKVSNGEFLATASTKHGLYNLNIDSMRGNIYDFRKRPLTCLNKDTVLAVAPNINIPSLLSKILCEDEMQESMELLRCGKPFKLIINSNTEIAAEGINCFKVSKRYTDNQIAPHIIGYLDKQLAGVYGIEKSFNDYLNKSKGSICVKYKVDALNRLMPGENVIVEDSMYKSTAGVVLTIDERIQQIAQNAAQKYIKKGAIVVTQVPNCEIRACLSMPSFSSNNVSKVLNDSDSPLLNRAFLPYNLGSVFKLITAAAAIDSGINPEEIFSCSGKLEVDKNIFHCFEGKAHGNINMEKAIAYSCNTYFIELAKKVGAEKIYNLSYNVGFSKPIELAPEMITKKGELPSKESLKSERVLANFSFGQGRLMTTPIQVSGLINTVASRGVYTEPKLVEGLVDENLNYIKKFDKVTSKRVISQNCANLLKEYMKASLEYGTGIKGKPNNGTAAVKTGTAQTGIKIDGRAVIQGWYAGFYPADNPKYSIIVFAEDAKGGGESCGPAFKKIADDIYNDMKEVLEMQ